ncbi:MAG TPA: EAL domain-containing protein [Dokdonella sp.]|uniref:EAL domain-containing protein n=1 Tax=Dokdonella sp. TaxID=2291710 RepID=UPI002D7E731A|nr:EAL domain-containing protein [Dokdonella sp.]HET9031602.1 EAL domain-containing protein [Dokdonella sp.]
MRRMFTAKVVLAIAIIGFILPITIALYIAHRQSMESEIELASAMSSEALRRADESGRQSIAAWERIQSATKALDCSNAGIALMRDVDMDSSYLQIVGLVVNGRLACSSLGRHEPAIPLGPVDYVSSFGTQVRLSNSLGFNVKNRFLLLQKDDAIAGIHPEELIDVFVNRKDISLGVYGVSSGTRLSSRGFFDPRWLTRLGSKDATVFFDGHYLVSMERSKRFDLAAYVAVPKANLIARLMAFARVLVPIALVLAAALTFAIVKIARQRASLPTALRTALKRGEFDLHYQPIVELESRRIVGVEALLRWSNRDGPMMRPDLFIPVAEESGLIPQITDYVIKRLAQDLPRLSREFPDCHVSMNLASSDLHSERIVDALRKLVQTRGITASNIIVEATEHSFRDPDRSRHVLAGIRELGIRVAIDDFGTGYSNLSQLTTQQTDYLKIDKVFVDTVGTDSPTSQVALHIIYIADSLGLKIIGEGVETELQAEFLREHGVQFAQGWLFHKAMPMDELLELIRRRTVS